jgi:N-acetylneuraminic acid mutarotase
MMSSTYEQRRLPLGFTFRIVEAVKRIKINPMPRMAGLPWGLSAAVGIIITVLSLNPHISIPSHMATPAGSPLPVQSKVLKIGEISVDILKTAQISVIASKQGDGDGGEPQQHPQKAFHLAPAVQGNTWRKRADMPTARRSLSTSAVNGKIYAIGGYGPNRLSTVEEYDPVTDKWTKKADMPTARQGLSTSVLDGRIYAIGGWTGKRSSSVEEYDPATDKWTKKADMQIAREGLSTSTVNGKIYAIGGIGGGWFTSSVEEYDPATDTWTEKAGMPTARGSFSTSVVDGRIYAIGGWKSPKHLATVEEYDPVTDTWTRKANMPTARGYLSTSVVKGKIYAIGGVTGPPPGDKQPFPVGWMASSTVERYDPATDTWTKEANMPTARGFLSTSAVKGKIYAIGGNLHRPDVQVSTVEEYDTGLAVEPKGKLATAWGKLKVGH